MGIEAIKIDKNSKLPKYKQLSEQIENLIMSGELSPGEKLPTERLLEEITGISRGTIKAAYYELQKTGRIKTIQGSGSFVTEYTHEEAKKMAEESVEKLFKQMQVLELTLPEIEHIFQKQLDKRYEYSKRVKVAWVDCCVECLSIISDQLEPMRSISLETYLLDEVLENPKILPNEYDLLVTTSRHFDALAPLLPDKLERMEKVTLDLKMATVIELVKIPADARVALWSISDTFVPIMAEGGGCFAGASGLYQSPAGGNDPGDS